MRVSSPSAFTADSAAMVCISVSAVPPDFEMATKRVVWCGSLASSVAKRVGIEIVHEMQARRRTQRADARHRVTGELRQRLAAEAGAAGAEDHDVGGVLGESLAGVADRRQIVTGFRQPAAAAGRRRRGAHATIRARPRRDRARRSAPCRRRRAARSLRSSALSMDWTMAMAAGLSARNAHAAQPVHSALDVSPFGRPATVTSMPPPNRRLATRLASVDADARRSWRRGAGYSRCRDCRAGSG